MSSPDRSDNESHEKPVESIPQGEAKHKKKKKKKRPHSSRKSLGEIPVNLEIYRNSAPGHVGNLNESQQEAVDQLKQKIAEFVEESADLRPILEHLQKRDRMVGEHEDVMYLQFLRARQFNVKASFELLSDALRWRKDFCGIGVDNIPKEDVVEEMRAGKCFYHGFDKQGRPVVYAKVRLHDKSVNQVTLQKHAIYMFEEMRWKVLRPPMETSTVVFDMKDFSIQKNMDYPFVKFLASVFESRYPETLGFALVLDSPWIFQACWKIIKPWLDPHTASKVQFVNKAELTNYIAEDQLLTELGGKNDYHPLN